MTPTSPLPGIIRSLRDNWRIWHRTQPGFDRDKSLVSVIGGMIQNYHGFDGMVFNKSRDWPALIETLEAALGRKVRIIATVRPLTQVAASMEMIWRRNLGLGRVPAQLANNVNMMTTRGRVSSWLNMGDVIGSAINVLGDAGRRGYGDRILMVEYDSLTKHPLKTMRSIEEFLEIPRFKYDFENVNQMTVEDDEWHGYSGLHDIRPIVTPSVDHSASVLGSELHKQLSDTIYPWDMVIPAAKTA